MKKSVQALARRIERENELFLLMSNDEKKVVIAKDCMERIKLNQFKSDKGSLCSLDFKLSRQRTVSLKSVLNDKDFPTCKVCAKGGLFMSYVGRTNEFLVGDVTNSNDIKDGEHKKLLEIFTMRELAFIEFAFEGQQYLKLDEVGNQIIFEKALVKKAQRFYIKYGGHYMGEIGDEAFEAHWSVTDDANKRLMAICRNIVKNKGHFIL